METLRLYLLAFLVPSFLSACGEKTDGPCAKDSDCGKRQVCHPEWRLCAIELPSKASATGAIRYAGELKDSQPHGQGKADIPRLAKGLGLVFEGRWENGDLPSGTLLLHSDGSTTRYTGELQRLVPHGRGIRTLTLRGDTELASTSDGLFSHSKFVSGKMQTGGDQLEGEFDEDHLKKGTRVTSRGTREEGEFSKVPFELGPIKTMELTLMKGTRKKPNGTVEAVP